MQESHVDAGVERSGLGLHPLTGWTRNLSGAFVAHLRTVDGALSLLGLTVLLAFAFAHLYTTLFRSWFLSSDEYVFAAEVIRFLDLDFRQRFFDIPGTPFMLFNALLWAGLYGVMWLGGFVAAGTGLDDFTFQHLPWLFVQMRAATVGFFLLSAALLYAFVARLAGAMAGLLAAMLLVMSPTYATYSSFVRTESLALVLILMGALILLGGVERHDGWQQARPRLGDPALLAGLCAGLAGASRLHSVAAVMPMMAMMLWLHGPREREYPRWARRWLLVAVPLTVLAAFAARVLARATLTTQPGALHFITNITAGWMTLCVLSAVLYAVPRTRPLVVVAWNPALLKLALGAVAGFFLGNFTIVTQLRYFLQSVEMYSNYVDRDRMLWPLWQNLTWYVQYYTGIAAPDRVILWLYLAGALLIVIRRDRRLLPLLAASLLFFVSKPLNLVAAAHHIVPWMPFFFAVAAYPLARVVPDGRSPRARRRFAAVVSVAAVLAIAATLTRGPALAASGATSQEERMRNIERATAWIKQHTPTDSIVAVAYFCFNADTFYSWLEALAVPVPASVDDGRSYRIWWGHQSALRGQTGYACATPSDVDAMKTKLELAMPGEGTDPYTDKAFVRVASFGKDGSQVDVFRFALPPQAEVVEPQR